MKNKTFIYIFIIWFLSQQVLVPFALANEATSSGSTSQPEVLGILPTSTPTPLPTPTQPPPLIPTPSPSLTAAPTIIPLVPTPTITTLPKNKAQKLSLAKQNFQANEKIEIDSENSNPNDLKIAVYKKGGEEIPVKIVEEDGKLKINPSRDFRPGKYTIKIENNTTKDILLEQDFTWGVLAINTNKSVYLPGDKAYLQMAALKDDGHTICDGSLKLQVTNPKSQIETFLTENNTIQKSGKCLDGNVSYIPDYFAHYKVNLPGSYELKFTNLTNDYEIVDHFEVVESVGFAVERLSATRIYPPADYYMKLEIRANEDFQGEVIEKVPSSFEIMNAENVITDGQEKILSWNVDWKKGESYELAYNYNAPDISPQFYLLGPLKFINSKGETVFQETRQWQIAADVACSNNDTGSWNDGTKWTGCTGGGVPAAGDTVTIIANTTMTLNTDATVAGLTICGTTCAKAAILTHSGTYKLTVNGTVTMNQPTGNARTNDWQINAGSADVSGLITFAGADTTTSRVAQITITTGTLNANGGMTFTASAAATKVIYMSGYAGWLNLKGALTIGAASSTFTMGTSGSIFSYADSAAAQTVNFPSAGAYNYLYLNNTHANGVTLGAAMSTTNVTGGVTVGDGSTAAIFKNGTYNIVGNTGEVFTVNNAATFQMDGTTATFPTGFTGGYTFGATSTTIYNQTSAQNISTQNYGNLKFTPAGTVTYTLQSGSLGVQGNLTVGNGSNAVTVTGVANDPTITVTGDVTIAAGSPAFVASDVNSMTVGGSWSNSGTFTSTGSTVVFNAATSKTINPGGSSFNNVQFNNVNGGWTASTNTMTIAGALTVTAGNFDTGAVTNAVTGATDVTGTLTISSTAGTKTFTGNVTVNAGGTWSETAAEDVSFGGNLTNNATTWTALAGTHTFTGSNKTISGSTTTVIPVVNIANGASVTNSGTMTVSTTLTTPSGTSTFTNGDGSTGTLNFGGSSIGVTTFTASAANNTVNYNSSSASQTILGVTYYNLTITTTSARTINFPSGVTTTITNALTLTGTTGPTYLTLAPSTAETVWTIDPPPSNISVDYVSVSYSTATECISATNSYNGGSNTKWTYNGASCNQSPNSPADLAQKKTDDTTLNTGDWTNETSVKFTALADDTDNPDTLYLCVEKDDIDTAFSDTEDSCGTGVAYSGTPVTVTVTISGITDVTQYHWHARVKDTASAYSSWVAYGGNSDITPGAARDFGIDTTAPTDGIVYDGTETGVDHDFNNESLSQLSANWSGFDANVSGLSYYEYSIGTTVGGTNVKNWTNNNTTTSVTAISLTLQTSAVYYFNVRAIDNAGNIQSAVSSDGQVVSPSLTFTVSPATLSFSNLNSGNSYTDSKNTTLTTSTNAYGGYLIRAYVTDYLRSTDTTKTIPDFDGGTYSSPGTWGGGNTGFGYTSLDTTIQGLNKFSSGTLHAPFSQTGPGDIVADHTDNVTGSPISNEQFTITNKVKTSAIQEAVNYVTTVIYTITAQY